MYKKKMKKRSFCCESLSSQDIVSNVKISKELDEKLLFSPPPNLDPLQIDLIAQKVMSFLNGKDFKSARFISEFWAAEGGEQLLIKSYLYPELCQVSLTGFLLRTKQKKKEFLNFLSLAKPSSRFKLCNKSINIVNILETFPELAERVRELKYETDSQYCNMTLVEALKKLPRLEILDTDYLVLSMNIPSWWDWFFNQPDPLRPEQLVSLKDIRLNFPFNLFDSSSCQSLVGHGSSLKNITKIILDKPDIQIMNFLISDELKWPLNHITWKFVQSCRQIHKNSIRQFFVKYSDTLKFLDIQVSDSGLPLNYTPQTPWLDDWLLPVNFPVLETMVISGTDENILPFLAIALQFPRLKKLVLSHVPERVNEIILKWEEHPLAGRQKLQSLTIEEVELGSLVNYSSAAVLWPNLKSLKLYLDQSSEFLSPHLFSCWQGLEKLDLSFQSITSFGFQLIQEWLMGGVQYPENYEKGSVIVKASKMKSSAPFPASKLLDLKNLKSLTLRFPKNFLLGDFLVFNCLQFMTNLKSLHLLGETKVSSEAVNLLETRLGENASVVVKKQSEENELYNDTRASQVFSWAYENIKDYWIDILAIIMTLLIVYCCSFSSQGMV